MMFSKKIKLVLRVENDMSLSDFLDLMKQCPKGIQLYIIIENRWKFIHSIVAVKQIKESLENIEAFIQTEDSVGKKLLESVNIPSFENIPEQAEDFYEELLPERKFEKNNIGEAFKSQEFEVIKVIQQSGKEHIHKAYEAVHELSLKNKILLGISSLASIGVLSFLIALVIPSATISIATEKKMVETIVNANFIKTEETLETPLQSFGNNFHLYPVELHFEDSFDFPVISKIFEGQHAEGIVTMYNDFPEDITLRNGTKLQTENGLIFETTHYVRIPGRKRVTNEDGQEVLEPGRVNVEVQAIDTDIFGEVIGSRGNIKDQKFSVPGLTFYMQKFIWGENVEAFTGGTTRWRIEVQESDLASAKEKMENVLFSTAKETIVQHLNEKNLSIPKKMSLFPLEEFITKTVVDIQVPENILGQSLKSFPVKGEMIVSAYAFPQLDFEEFMQKHIHAKRDPNMKIELVDFSTMTLRKFDETPSEIRITAHLQGRQSYQIDETSDEGKDFQEKIKQEIRGMNTEAALRILHNKQEISKTAIRIWPPIKKQLPLIEKNIKIVEMP